MSYYFYIGDMKLPIPPEKMSVRINSKNKTINLINEGEINIIKTPGLSEISFDARLPNKGYPFADYDNSLMGGITSGLTRKMFGGNSSFSFTKASVYLDKMEKIKTSKKPVRLIISRMAPGSFNLLFSTNMLVTLEDYSVDEDANDGNDVTVPLRLKQYKPYGTKNCTVKTDKNGKKTISVSQARQAEVMTLPKSCIVGKEQSAWEVIQQISGGSLDWRTILANNGIGSPFPPVGTVLYLG